MLLRNFYRALCSNAFLKDNIGYVNYSGAVKNFSTQYYEGIGLQFNYNSSSSCAQPSVYFMRTTTADYSGVLLGTGTTPVTENDYCLSGNIISNYTYIANVAYESANEAGGTLTAVYTITNTGSSSFTVGEIGLFAQPTGGKTTATAMLVERTVLTEPLTLAPNEIGQIEYKITMVAPTTA